jgi:glutaminase
MMGKIQTRMLVATFVVITFVSSPLSAPGQKASPVAPTKAQVEAVVREAYDKFQSNTSGKNADYIPFLAQVDSKMFGVAVVSTDNQVFSIGETNYSFSIQSISKVYTLALAMEELGADRVFDRIGSEPTGRAFNSVTAVVEMPTHTANPLVNAGAIATTSLILGKDANDKWNKILDFYSRTAGEKLTLIDEVYKSEAATNAGNKALAMLLAKYERIYGDPFESVDI